MVRRIPTVGKVSSALAGLRSANYIGSRSQQRRGTVVRGTRSLAAPVVATAGEGGTPRNVGMGIELREVWYSGHVQGVGFRCAALAVARRHGVSGYVRNLSDGRVNLVAEGQVDQLDAFLAALADRMQECIRDVRQDHRPATGRYSRFEIRS